MMWSTQEALKLIRIVHPEAYACGWNLHLGGGLATKEDTSDKDADILAMPRYQTRDHDQGGLLAAFGRRGWAYTGLETLPHRRVCTLRKDGKVVDLIFVLLPLAE